MTGHRDPARGYGQVGTLAWSSGVPRLAAPPTCVPWDLAVRSRCEKCLVDWRCPSSRIGSGGLQFGKQHSCYQHDGLFLEDNRTTRKLDHGGSPDHCGCANHRAPSRAPSPRPAFQPARLWLKPTPRSEVPTVGRSRRTRRVAGSSASTRAAPVMRASPYLRTNQQPSLPGKSPMPPGLPPCRASPASVTAHTG